MWYCSVPRLQLEVSQPVTCLFIMMVMMTLMFDDYDDFDVCEIIMMLEKQC